MKQKMSKEEYGKFVKQQTPPSKLGANCIKAFLVGGTICVLGQALMDIYQNIINIPEKTASTLVSVTLIFIASLLTALNIYPSIAKFAAPGVSNKLPCVNIDVIAEFLTPNPTSAPIGLFVSPLAVVVLV